MKKIKIFLQIFIILTFFGTFCVICDENSAVSQAITEVVNEFCGKNQRNLNVLVFGFVTHRMNDIASEVIERIDMNYAVSV